MLHQNTYYILEGGLKMFLVARSQYSNSQFTVTWCGERKSKIRWKEHINVTKTGWVEIHVMMSLSFSWTSCWTDFSGPEQLFLLHSQLMFTANYNLASVSHPFAHSIICQEPQWECKYKVKSSSRTFFHAISQTLSLCDTLHMSVRDRGRIVVVCLVQRPLRVTHFCDDDRWEMETDFSWDSKHCELLTGTDTQRQREEIHTQPSSLLTLQGAKPWHIHTHTYIHAYIYRYT